MVATVKRYAIYHPVTYWLVDTCAGGTWSENVHDAVWFKSLADATAALVAAEIDLASEVVICRVQ